MPWFANLFGHSEECEDRETAEIIVENDAVVNQARYDEFVETGAPEDPEIEYMIDPESGQLDWNSYVSES